MLRMVTNLLEQGKGRDGHGRPAAFCGRLAPVGVRLTRNCLGFQEPRGEVPVARPLLFASAGQTPSESKLRNRQLCTGYVGIDATWWPIA
jgi:hypothetical protein